MKEELQRDELSGIAFYPISFLHEAHDELELFSKKISVRGAGIQLLFINSRVHSIWHN